MKLIKIIKYLFLLFIIAIIVMITFSPYGKQKGFHYKLVKATVEVNATSQEVYDYLGISKNAEDWSVYVDHITPINLTEFEEGEVGAIRRCFKNKEETGIIWDEKTVINEKNKRRRLTIFNMKGFSLMADNLLTEQLYEEKNGKCNVSLTLFYNTGKSNWIDELKMYFAAYIVKDIFERNLEQIKILNEKKL